MDKKNGLKWFLTRGDAPLKPYDAGNQVAGAGVIIRDSKGWHRSNDLGTRYGHIVNDQVELIRTAKGYNTLSYDEAFFLDDLLNRKTVDTIGVVEMEVDQNAGFFIGYYHETEKEIGIIARYVEVQHASGSLFGYGHPIVVEGDDIKKAYRLSNLPNELDKLRQQNHVTNKYATKAFESVDFLRMTSELYTMFFCSLNYGAMPEILSSLVMPLMHIATTFVGLKAFRSLPSYNRVIKEEIPQKIALKEKELEEARKIKTVSDEPALDILYKLYKR